MFGIWINYTQALSGQVGTTNMQNFYAYLTGNPSQSECEEADCLHPCYGASHEANCSLCFQIAFSAEAQDLLTTDEFMETCNACSVPVVEVEVPAKMTLEEYEAYIEEEEIYLDNPFDF